MTTPAFAESVRNLWAVAQTGPCVYEITPFSGLIQVNIRLALAGRPGRVILGVFTDIGEAVRFATSFMTLCAMQRPQALKGAA